MRRSFFVCLLYVSVRVFCQTDVDRRPEALERPKKTETETVERLMTIEDSRDNVKKNIAAVLV